MRERAGTSSRLSSEDVPQNDVAGDEQVNEQADRVAGDFEHEKDHAKSQNSGQRERRTELQYIGEIAVVPAGR